MAVLPLQRPRPLSEGEAVAALDLGSNSFHMVAAEVRGGQLVFVDRRREVVRLAAGLDDRKRLTPEASARALACLDRFGERIRSFPAGTVRIVGTNTLRRARNARDLLEAAERSLGHPVEIVSGLEEARLIYLGVSKSLAGDERRLVVDIGGGSTELIVGEGSEPRDLESLYMGCVSMSLRHFPNGRAKEKRWRRAEIAALQELEPVRRRFQAGAGWNSAVGSSGTVRSVAAVVQAAGWCEEGITLEALVRLRELLVERGSAAPTRIRGLSDGRAPVFAGGVAVLLAVFRALGIRRMRVAGGALREGVLYDLLGRLSHEDTRHAAVESMARRYHVEPEQAARVRATALQLLEQCAARWGLAGELPWLMLSWAAQLHEVGLDINHAGFHRHGAYIVENAELHGFSLQEHVALAALVRSHRRRFRHEVFDRLPSAWRQPACRVAVLLRLAVVLHRSRRPQQVDARLEVDGRRLRLVLPKRWLETSPLTRADLRQEARFLAVANYRLTVEEDDSDTE